MFIEWENIIWVKRQLESELVHEKGDCDRYCIPQINTIRTRPRSTNVLPKLHFLTKSCICAASIRSTSVLLLSVKVTNSPLLY